MSGIVGIYYRNDKPVNPDQMGLMLDGLSHRGKDGADLWIDRSVGLGHRMLWSTPESLGEKLPNYSHNRGLAITSDARIDNRDELISQLELDSSMKQAITDSQIILAAYQKWGQDCPQRLLGVFAFAIWDERRQQMFCARDCFGIKPFYYHRSSGAFAFASEIEPLFCVPQVSKQLNKLRIAQYLIHNVDDKEITFYQDIYRLPPAHSLVISLEGFSIQKYWSLDPEREVCLSSKAEYAEAYRELFTKAVKSRLRTPSNIAVGSMLSGGLDSSSICCTARNLLRDSNKKLHTFSGIFPSLPEEDLKCTDERLFMDVVLNTGGFIPHQTRGDLMSPFYQQQEIFRRVGEAYMGPNYYLNWAIYEQAKQLDVGIILDGIDGDTTVSHGFECFADLARRGKWRKVYQEAKKYSRNVRQALSPSSIIWKYAMAPNIPSGLMNPWQSLVRKNKYWSDSSLISAEFAREINLEEDVERLNQSEVPSVTARQLHWHGMNAGIHSYVLELTDKGTSNFGVEARYPFFDRRLVEFCVSVPVEKKFANGWPRYMARIGMEGVLPPEVQRRVCKANLGKNFQRKLLGNEHKVCQQVIDSNSPVIAAYLDIDKLKSTYEKCQSRKANSNEIFTLYTAINLSLWLEEITQNKQKKELMVT